MQLDLDERSNELFGRYDALRVYASLARLAKSEFETGQLALLAGLATPIVSKELGRLARLDLVSGTSRRGNYQREMSMPFWGFMDQLAHDWGYPA